MVTGRQPPGARHQLRMLRMLTAARENGRAFSLVACTMLTRSRKANAIAQGKATAHEMVRQAWLRIAGIDVRLHASFALICLWSPALRRDTGSLWGVLNGVTLVLLLFLCVLLHEFGHELTARRFGIGTRHITLWPIGGIALLEAIRPAGTGRS